VTDSAPAPLTAAERVALTIAAQTLRSTVATLNEEWAVFVMNNPDKVTPDIHRGYLLAVHRIAGIADNIERNRNAQGVRPEERCDPEPSASDGVDGR
jgi:hypothetical protein